MSHSSDPAPGPDLRQGVTVGEIPGTGVLQGQVDGDPVLLVRRGEEFYAIGAMCTHYGGALADGLITDTTIRCPLHHACFDLHTGEAIRGPALAPVARYLVERRGERIMVGDRAPAPTPPPRGHAGGLPGSIVIVGAGAAGTSAALTLRREGFTGNLTLVSAEPVLPYDRPMISKELLSGSGPEEWLPLRPREEFESLGIRLLLGVPVQRLDPAARIVALADGRTLAWDALLIATGATPVRPPIMGIGGPNVHVLRTVADSRAIIERSATERRVVILGAGFLGLEVAGALRARGLEVHLVAPDRRPLEKVLGPELGLKLQRLHESHGVAFHLGHSLTEVGLRMVRLDDGSELEAELVVVATGVQPNTLLAARAGLVLNRGVMVDKFLETSRRGIFAAGDVARWPDPRTGEPVNFGHWVHAERMGQTAARNMLGMGEAFDAVPFFWSQHYDMRINMTGHAGRWDLLEIVSGLPADQWEQRYYVGDEVVAVATINRDVHSLEAEVGLERSVASRAAQPAGAAR